MRTFSQSQALTGTVPRRNPAQRTAITVRGGAGRLANITLELPAERAATASVSPDA
ncbi:MAG: hypothetical protein IJR72_00010 [Oscillospiraceae bacterium]|nr:hypothetical protein [Oscillospiraceae bacterium]